MGIPRKPGFPTAAATKNMDQVSGLEKKEEKQFHSSMRHLALTCCIILQSIIKMFQMVTEKQARNEVKIWIRGHN